MLQTDDEIREMVALGRRHGVEVCLFVGPRANWDVGIQAASTAGRVVGSSLRGADQLAFGIEDVLHGVTLGMNSILVADLGQLMLLGRMKKSGDLPPDFVLKTSVTLAAPNPAAARLLEDLGATSLNLPVDLTLPQIAAIRQAVDVAIDFYIESPDDFGGGVRYYEIPEMVRVAAPDLLEVRYTQFAAALSGRPASRGDGASRCPASACGGPPSAWASFGGTLPRP